jgi:hypothetical protein
MLLGPSGGAHAQTAEPGTLTIVKECTGVDPDEDMVFDIFIDFQFGPNIVEAGPPVNEDTAFDIDNIELHCDEFIDLTVEDDFAAQAAWFEANGASVTDVDVTIGEANLPANVTATFSGDCHHDESDIETFFAEGLVCTITNHFNTGNTNTNTNVNNIPIDIRNQIQNTLDNLNDNGNNNENANTQEQANKQDQVNNNNQTTTVNSGPSVVIRGNPNKDVKPATPPTTGSGPTVVAPPSTGEGFLRAPSTGEGFFIAPPNTGDAGLLSSERSESGALLPMLLLASVTGVITLVGVMFSRAGR